MEHYENVKEKLAHYRAFIYEFSPVVLSTTCAIFFGYVIGKNVNLNRKGAKLLEIAQKKRSDRDLKLKNQLINLDFSKESQDIILSSSVTELRKLLDSRKITSEQILLTYFERTRTIGRELDLICETRFDEALKEARKCDEIRASMSDLESLPALFGIPMSIKESILIEGLDSTYGVISKVNKPQKEDGAAVKHLKKNGAIPYVTTNIPQLLNTVESVNHIYGRAKNPWNRARTPGGTSGGEAGLIAAKGSPIGLASDGAGSIRIPSLFCGVYGFKPTNGRVCNSGIIIERSSALGKENTIPPTLGAIGRCVDDLILLTKAINHPDLRDLEPERPYLPLRDELLNSNGKKLKIGYFVSDPLFPVSKADRRAINEAVEALRSRGHEVVEIERFPNFEELTLTTFGIFTADGAWNDLENLLQGEKIISEMRMQLTYSSYSRKTRGVVAKLLKGMEEERLHLIAKSTGERKVSEYFEVLHNLHTFQRETYKWWVEKRFDAVICPGVGTPAFKHGFSSDLTASTSYSMVFNALNMPAGVVPITLVKKEEEDYAGCGPEDSISKKTAENLKGSAGMPVGLQVVSLPWEDEKCLVAMKEIEAGIGFHKFPNI